MYCIIVLCNRTPQRFLTYRANFTINRLHFVGVSSVRQSFVDMMAQTMASAHLVSRLPDEQVSLTHPQVWHIVNNRETVSTALRASQQLRYLNDQHNGRHRNTGVVVVTVVAICVLFTEILIVIVPTIVKVRSDTPESDRCATDWFG